MIEIGLGYTEFFEAKGYVSEEVEIAILAPNGLAPASTGSSLSAVSSGQSHPA